MKHAYFVITTEQQIYDFDQQCTHLDYADPHYLICSNEDGDSHLLLGMIPHSLITSVLRVEG